MEIVEQRGVQVGGEGDTREAVNENQDVCMIYTSILSLFQFIFQVSISIARTLELSTQYA